MFALLCFGCLFQLWINYHYICVGFSWPMCFLNHFCLYDELVVGLQLCIVYLWSWEYGRGFPFSNNSGMWNSLSRERSHIFCNYAFKCTVFGLWTWLDYGGLFLARPWKEIRFIYWMGWWFRKFTFVISYIYLHDFSVHWLWNSAS